MIPNRTALIPSQNKRMASSARSRVTVALVVLLLLSCCCDRPVLAQGPQDGAADNVMEGRQSGGVLQFTGNTAYPYDLCEGDCDSDEDCVPGLICYQRSGFDSVPGCSGGGDGDREDVDYCVPGAGGDDDEEEEEEGEEEAEEGGEGTIEDVGGDVEEGGLQLGHCAADCDDDTECESGLICYQRDGDEAVPGCNGTPRTGWDYCIYEADLLVEEEMPLDTPEPTKEPTAAAIPEEVPVQETASPTKAPTKPNPGRIYTYEDGTEPNTLRRCHGDCNKDSDCASDLICFIRTNKSPDEVYGCKGTADGGNDYCIDPADLPPTPEPTSELSPKPTKRPTKAPTMVPTKAPTLNPTRPPVKPGDPTGAPSRKPTRRPTAAPVEVDDFPGVDSTTPDGGEGFDSADTTVWVDLSPFEVSLDFQTINNRRRKLLRASSSSASATATATAAVLRDLQALGGMIETENLEEVLGDLIGNKMGALSTSYRELDLEVDFLDEKVYDDGKITVVYDAWGRAAFDAADGAAPPSEEEVRRATEEAVEEDALVRDLRRLGDRDLVLSSVQDTSVTFTEPSSPFGTTTSNEEGEGEPKSSSLGLVEILVLVIIIVTCIGVTCLAILYVRKRRRDKLVKSEVEKNRVKMDMEERDRSSQRDSSTPNKTTKTWDTVKEGPPPGNTPPAKAPKPQEPPGASERVVSTPPTPALTPPGTISVKKGRNESAGKEKKASTTMRQLFVRDSAPKSSKRTAAGEQNGNCNERSARDPPELDSDGGESTLEGDTANEWSYTGIDRSPLSPNPYPNDDTGLASLTSCENIDTDINEDTDADGDNTVSDLSDNLTFGGGTAAGESILLGKDGIRLESVLRLEETPEDNVSDIGEHSAGNRPRYRNRAANVKRKSEKRAASKKKRAPPMPSAAASDLEGQVKAFEEHVLGISLADAEKLPARVRRV
mmetsp:Transcript_20396/g.44559  ORF Transcript_20396/g.44559 Transcript_20396/m.44559 type:complete len:942 (-) Transcript_20396:165-2990(-)